MAEESVFLGHQALFGAAKESTWGTAIALASLTNAFVFESETIAKHGNIIERQGLRGTRSHAADDARFGPYSVGGNINMQPTPVDLQFWLEYILGTAPSTNSYVLGESLESLTLGFSRGPKKVRYGGCRVDRATFSGSQGGMLGLSMDVAGKTEETLETGSWPAITADVVGPYVFCGDLVFTVNSVARPIQSFELVVDNSLIKDRFMNSLTVTALPTGDRTVTLRTTHAWNSTNTDIYDIAGTAPVGGFSSATLVLTSTIGSHVTTFAFGALSAPALSPTAANRQENMLTLDWTARSYSGAKELVVTST